MTRDGDPRELERAGRHEDAATAAERAGAYADAARLWEIACRWDRASRASLAAGDAARAALHAGRSGDPALLEAALEALEPAPGAVATAARRLEQAGCFSAAARAAERAGDAVEACRLHERSGDLGRAAAVAAALGDPRRAARLWERLLERDPTLDDARAELAECLLATGRPEAAARALQRRPGGAPEDSRGRDLLARALAAWDGGREQPRAPSPAAPADRQILFGRYELVAEVARTPTARVFRALDRGREGAEVAVKVCSVASLADGGRDAIARYEREARALGSLAHPAIVPLVAWEPGGPAIVTEWMAGGSLADRLEAQPLSPAHAAEVVEQVLLALREAHRRGVLHRDVKPANVLFDSAGAARLADFGVAHVSDAAATVTAGVLGTLAYMAPEQRAGAPATPASDVYGAGALLWHALHGAPPGAVPGAPLSSDLGPEALRVARALVAECDQRPRDVDEALASLRGVEWPRRVPAPREDAPPRAPGLDPRAGSRLVQDSAGLWQDTLLDRPLEVVADTPAIRATVRALASLREPPLPAVLAWRAADRTFWLSRPVGPRAGWMTPAERESIDRALEAIRAGGGDPARFDPTQAIRTPRGIALRLGEPRRP